MALVGLATMTNALAGVPPSRPEVDAPELAHLGPFPVGLRTIKLVQHDQADLLAFVADQVPSRADRILTVDIWYPAAAGQAAGTGEYSASLESETPGRYARFRIPSLSLRNARSANGRFPLVIVSHGRRNATVTLSWLTENLASKGYVVAAIRHEDPSDISSFWFTEPLLRRPLDIAFVAGRLQDLLAAEGLIDPRRTALIGYSMGGYGVLAAAGAQIDPAAAEQVPGGMLLPYAAGGPLRDTLIVRNLKAVVALAPSGGGPPSMWGRQGLEGISAPLLLIAGDRDHTIDYARGAHAFFEGARRAHRYLLTFEGAGHAIGLNYAPQAMRSTLWDLSWFEDPVWRKERIIGVNLHMITAFLDLYVKEDLTRAPYLDGLVPEASSGEWPVNKGVRFDAYSPGTSGITVWKGFQRNYAEGLRLEQKQSQGDTESSQ
ncbi:MAG: dienelactone hydrolase [Proteobacteria bacterium]|nr:dienelactone hydrolase [Pseudomonadota bacterium]